MRPPIEDLLDAAEAVDHAGARRTRAPDAGESSSMIVVLPNRIRSAGISSARIRRRDGQGEGARSGT